jgi:TPR repeat protein
MYEDGEGVGQSHEEAVKWYTKSAEQGYAMAQYNLALNYYNGKGVGQSHEEAVSIICKESGSHFDPDVVEAFLTFANDLPDMYKQFENTEKEYAI